MDNRINFIIPDEDVAIATEKLGEGASTMQPYLIALKPSERQELPKMSDKTLPFVEKITEYCQSAPQFVPAYMDVEALAGDFKVTQQLTGLFRTVKAMHDNLDDTIMQAGSEAYMNALNYYNSVKQAAKSDVPGAKSIYEDLKKRFEKTKPVVVQKVTPTED